MVTGRKLLLFLQNIYSVIFNWNYLEFWDFLKVFSSYYVWKYDMYKTLYNEVEVMKFIQDVVLFHAYFLQRYLTSDLFNISIMLVHLEYNFL